MVVDDDKLFSSIVKSVLRRANLDIVCVASPSEALATYAKEKMDFDLLLIDYHFKNSSVTGTELALRIKRDNPHQTIMYMTGFEEREILVAMLETGASQHFIAKGGDPNLMVTPVMKVLSANGCLRTAETEDTFEDQQQRQLELKSLGIVGRSKSMHAIAQSIAALKKFRSRFLIIGGSGAGKELLAQAFRNRGEPFVAVDCTRFSQGQEHFLEPDLFGYQKGAYTGAHDAKPGALELANGGILFLDEIHHLSLIAQSKLLRTLQEMKYVRMGDTKERSFNVTVVAAAKPHIKSMLASGAFQEDLYYRLARTVFEVPSLEERRDDIAPLAKHFAEFYSATHGRIRDLHPQTIREFEAYSWPGNVRELAGLVENLVMTSTDEVIGPEAFRCYLNDKMKIKVVSNTEPKVDLEQVVKSVETEKIIVALRTSRTVGETAVKLGIARTTLNDRMTKLSIDPHAYLNKKGDDNVK
jgi:two-component system response regulator AtoC